MRKRCPHGKTRYCRTCHPNQLCAHGHASGCRDCHPNQFCTHGKRRCIECNPLKWAKFKLDSARRRSKKLGYKPPVITAEQVVQLLTVSKICYGCGEKLNWNDRRPPHLHHDHRTGIVYGFTHEICNLIEGFFVRIGKNRMKKLFQKFY